MLHRMRSKSNPASHRLPELWLQTAVMPQAPIATAPAASHPHNSMHCLLVKEQNSHLRGTEHGTNSEHPPSISTYILANKMFLSTRISTRFALLRTRRAVIRCWSPDARRVARPRHSCQSQEHAQSAVTHCGPTQLFFLWGRRPLTRINELLPQTAQYTAAIPTLNPPRRRSSKIVGTGPFGEAAPGPGRCRPTGNARPVLG